MPGRGDISRFNANNFFQIFARQRLDVSAVGDLRIGHDGGRVGIGQHHLESLGLERLASLRPGVIKLRRLANDDRARADDQDLRDVSSFAALVVDLHLSKINSVIPTDSVDSTLANQRRVEGPALPVSYRYPFHSSIIFTKSLNR